MDQEVQRNSDPAEASRAKRRLSSREFYGGEAQHQDTGLEIRAEPSARHGHPKNRLTDWYSWARTLSAGRSLPTGFSGRCPQRSGVWEGSPQPRTHLPGALLAIL